MKHALLLLSIVSVAACDPPETPAQVPVVETAPPHAAPPSAARTTSAESTRTTQGTTHSHASEPCGELVLTRAGLVAGGKGEAHPEVTGVDALLARCADKTPSRESCEHADREKTEAVGRGVYGENHPRMRALEAKLRVCRGEKVD